jgi:NDP-sugar pyrophosphorylase family protein
LQFLENTHINPGLGIILHKPLRAFTKNHVKLFFIYHKHHGEFIKETFYEYITNGWHKEVNNEMKHTKNLQKFINQPLSIARDKRIVFENTDTIFEEVSAQFKNFVAAPNTTYVAIYITPIPKTDRSIRSTMPITKSRNNCCTKAFHRRWCIGSIWAEKIFTTSCPISM